MRTVKLRRCCVLIMVVAKLILGCVNVNLSRVFLVGRDLDYLVGMHMLRNEVGSKIHAKPPQHLKVLDLGILMCFE